MPSSATPHPLPQTPSHATRCQPASSLVVAAATFVAWGAAGGAPRTSSSRTDCRSNSSALLSSCISARIAPARPCKLTYACGPRRSLKRESPGWAVLASSVARAKRGGGADRGCTCLGRRRGGRPPGRGCAVSRAPPRTAHEPPPAALATYTCGRHRCLCGAQDAERRVWGREVAHSRHVLCMAIADDGWCAPYTSL